MLAKIWEVAILCIVVALAAKLVVSTITPLIPGVIVLAVVLTVLGSIYFKTRRW